MADPADTRPGVDERRRQLLERGAELFATHSYAELSMARIAREVGGCKALLYHYFQSKQDFSLATLQQGAEQIARPTEPDPELPPLEALHGSLDAFLGWIERNETACRKLMESVGSVPDVKALVDGIRDATSAAARAWLVHGRSDPRLAGAPRPHARGARRLLLDALTGALSAAGSR